MLVQFIPTGEIMSTEHATYSSKLTGGPYDIPVLSSNYGGSLTSGSFLGYNASAGKSYVVWTAIGVGFVTEWKLDDATAVGTAITDLGAAYAANPDVFVTLDSDGTVT
jgi:hypothetical protein